MQDCIPPASAPANKNKAPPRKNTGTFEDPWRDWNPKWQNTENPHDLQERIAPTEAVEVHNAQERESRQCRRRLVDARLWDSFDSTLQQAATEIAYAFEALSKGLGFSTSNWNRVPGARNPTAAANSHARLTGIYIDWTRACHDAKVSHSMVIDILCFGISCKALDRDRRVRGGKSRQNLLDGLDLYARMRGWRRK